MPDLIGLQVTCPKCSHPFMVDAPIRRACRRISNMPPPNFMKMTQPRRVTANAGAIPPLKSSPAIPACGELTRVACCELCRVARGEPPSESAFDYVPQQPRAIALPPPIIQPVLSIKPLPRIWTAAESASFQIGLTSICFGLFALLLPLSGLRLNYFGASAPLIFALVIFFGCITCAFVMFRHHLNWVFMVTCLVLMLMILSLYRYTAAHQSANASSLASHGDLAQVALKIVVSYSDFT